MSSETSERDLLKVHQVSKSFPGVRALQGVSLAIRPGEAHALLGENGAGKSTLIKGLGGAHLFDSGTVSVLGKECLLHSPRSSSQSGIAIIYQEFNLIPGLSAADNIFLGQEKKGGLRLNRKVERSRALALFKRLDVTIDPDCLCRDLSIAEQQIVEIAKALSMEAKVLIMDEPSATLTNREVDKLFSVVRDLKREGIGILYVSHRLEEVFEICERATVLRDGEKVAECTVSEVDRAQLIEWMVGRELKDEFPRRDVELGETRLSVEGLSRLPAVNDISFAIRRGEILGLTGLVGAGRTELARAIFGADRKTTGTVRLDGRVLTIERPSDAIREKIGLLTEDRKTQGLILNHPIRENFGLPNLDWLSRRGFVRQKEENEAFNQYFNSLAIKASDAMQPAAGLSGGNQQKVVLAKWLARNCEVLIFDEPTRGVDVGAKYEIYLLMNELCAQGKSVLLISSELPEVLGMSDRILVMRKGEIAGCIEDVGQAKQEGIMEMAMH